jgi:hypothetical protein
MMLGVDFVDMASKKRLSDIMKGGRLRQYTLASFLGSTPGCLGAFMNVSLYVHGMISFGAIAGGMIATSGDEAFVMLARFPGTALLLFSLLFLAGIIFAWMIDKIIQKTKFLPCEPCLHGNCERCMKAAEKPENMSGILCPTNFLYNFRSFSFTRFLLILLIASLPASIFFGLIASSSWTWKQFTFTGLWLGALYITLAAPEHYLHDHIWEHIIKKHLFRVFLWSFAALLFVGLGLKFWNLDTVIHHHMIWVLIAGALMAIVPESGPHLLFVMMYDQGLVPFSVLFTSSFVQDGHGMLPLLSYSIKDSIVIKVLNFVFGLAAGSILFAAGL